MVEVENSDHERLSAQENGLGLKKYYEGDFEGALTSFQRAVELKPTEALKHLNLGSTAARLGKKTLALVSVGKAVELDRSLAERRVKHDKDFDSRRQDPAFKDLFAPLRK